MAMQTGLEGKPWYYGAIAGLVAAGVLYGLGTWQFLSPMKQRIVAQEQRLSELQTKIQEGRAAKLSLPQFREEVRRLELELDKLLRILPSRRNTPDLMRRIRTLMEQAAFELRRFTPGQLVDKDFYSEWPINIELHGDYHNLALFFDSISRFSRIVNIENLRVNALDDARAQNPQHTVTATFIAKTFVYKEPPEEGEETPSPGGRRAGP